MDRSNGSRQGQNNLRSLPSVIFIESETSHEIESFGVANRCTRGYATGSSVSNLIHQFKSLDSVGRAVMTSRSDSIMTSYSCPDNCPPVYEGWPGLGVIYIDIGEPKLNQSTHPVQRLRYSRACVAGNTIHY